MRAGHNMLHLTVHLMRDELPSASLALAELEAFVPDPRPLHGKHLREVPGERYRELYQRARSHYERLLNLQKELGLPLAVKAQDEPFLVLRREQVIATDQWLQEAWELCAPIEVRLHALCEDLTELDQLERSLDDFADLHIDLGQLHGEKQFLDLRIGMIPEKNIARLREALKMAGYLLLRVLGEGEVRRVALAGLARENAPLDKILMAAGFQPLELPASFTDEPQKIRQGLLRSREALATLRQQIKMRLANWVDTNKRELQRAVQLLDAVEPYLELDQAARAA